MVKSTILIAALILLTSSLHFTEKESGKVQVDVYYQALTDQSRAFFTGSLLNATQTPDFWKICDLKLYPYGVVQSFVWATSGWAFYCDHGEHCCRGNILENCAMKDNDFYTQTIPFLSCFESFRGGNIEGIGSHCAHQYGMNWKQLHKCFDRIIGTQLTKAAGNATQQVNPESIPWVMVNGEHSDDAQERVLSDIVKYVCQRYQGPESIKACL